MNIKGKIDLIKKQLPQFSTSQFQIQNEGWSNQVFCVDNTYIFRFPRTDLSLRDLEVEKVILPQLRENLGEYLYDSIEIPHFEFSSKSADEQAFVGYKMIPGVQMRREHVDGMSVEERNRNSQILGFFLSHLHTPSILNNVSILDIKPSQAERWLELKKTVHKKCKHVLTTDQLKWIDVLLNNLSDQSYLYEKHKILLHADFSSDHILFDPTRNTLTGIIDFGDLELGDPALDFTGLYLCYGLVFTQVVLKHYELKNTENNLQTDTGILDRVISLYSKQPCIHQLIHGVEKNSKQEIEEAIKQIDTYMKEADHE